MEKIGSPFKIVRDHTAFVRNLWPQNVQTVPFLVSISCKEVSPRPSLLERTFGTTPIKINSHTYGGNPAPHYISYSWNCSTLVILRGARFPPSAVSSFVSQEEVAAARNCNSQGSARSASFLGLRQNSQNSSYYGDRHDLEHLGFRQ